MRRTQVNIRTIGAYTHLRSAHLQHPQQWQSERRWHRPALARQLLNLMRLPLKPYLGRRQGIVIICRDQLSGGLLLMLPQASVGAAGGDELAVAALLDDAAVI